MPNIHDRGHANESFKLGTEIWMVDVCNPELGCPLRMANIGNICDSSLVQNEPDMCWNVELTHLVEGEVPVSFVFVGESHVFMAVGGASVVSNPDVITFLRHLYSWRSGLIIE